jgi:hypothetical protein
MPLKALPGQAILRTRIPQVCPNGTWHRTTLTKIFSFRKESRDKKTIITAKPLDIQGK